MKAVFIRSFTIEPCRSSNRLVATIHISNFDLMLHTKRNDTLKESIPSTIFPQ
uniref:Uncharacterized protein n=1 Tax=Arundo donax TaxID=35708 RepID=A0A0A8YYM8_ARUDO